MSKSVLIFSASPRRRGNSDLLCDAFLRGAEEAGHRAEKIFLRDQEIHYCNGCNACQRNGGTCAQKDDMAEILQKMIAADILVLATPIYFYAVSAQMKTLIDRTYARYTEIRDKEVYVLMTAAEDRLEATAGTLSDLRGFMACLPGAKEKGVVYGIGAEKKGEIRDKPAMQQAYEMGQAV